jgi:hypothetical protein
MSSDALFPISVTFEDGSTERYANVDELECNLEDFDSEQSPDCLVVDAQGRRLVLKLKMLELKELRVATP